MSKARGPESVPVESAAVELFIARALPYQAEFFKLNLMA
jgi:hypothetical protein